MGKQMPPWFSKAMADGGEVSKDRGSKRADGGIVDVAKRVALDPLGVGSATDAARSLYKRLRGNGDDKATEAARAASVGAGLGASGSLASDAASRSMRNNHIFDGEEDRKSGGRVKKREDGGEVQDKPYRPSNELAEGAQGKYLRDKAAKARKSETLSIISGAAKRLMPGNGLSRSINQLNALTDDAAASRERQKAKTSDREADTFDGGDKDRKSGGRVCRKDGGRNWIAGAVGKKGALHKALKVPMGEKIPAKKLDKAAHSDNPTIRKRANLAKTLKGFK